MAVISDLYRQRQLLHILLLGFSVIIIRLNLLIGVSGIEFWN